MGNRKLTSFLALISALLCLTTSKPVLAYQQEIATTIRVDSGWNLVSLPLHVSDGNTHILFPGAISDAFVYQSGYVAQETLRHGKGYWLKFPTSDIIDIIGTKCTTNCISLAKGWNLVGSIDITVLYSTFFYDPCTLTVSDFYEYNPATGYLIADSLVPGKGYWIKASSDGQLVYDSLGTSWNKISDILITNITVDHRNPNIIYGGLRSIYGSWRGRFYKSYDGGFSWDTVLTDLDHNGVEIDPIDDSTLYLMVGGAYCGPPSIHPGILKSTDAGANWFRADTGIYLDCETMAGICAIDYTNNEILYAIAGGFLPGTFYKSTNAGRSWFQPIDFDTIDYDIDPRCALMGQPNVIMNRTNPDILYAARVGWGDEILLKCTHGGEDWSYVGLLPENSDGSLANDIEQVSTLYTGEGGFYISTDEGKSWVMSNSGLPELSYVSGIMTTNNPQRLFICSFSNERFDIYETTDRGLTLNSLGCPDAVTMQDFDFDDVYNVIYALIDKKLYGKRFNKCFSD